MRVRKWPVVGLALAGLWLVVRGVELTPGRLLAEGLIGLGVGMVIAYGLRRMYLEEIDLVRNLRVVPTAVYYTLVFLWEVLTANVDVAYRVLHPAMPIEPDVVEVPLRVQSDAAITTIANSISLTPGTLTMDHDPETNTLYVHGIVGRRREQVLAPIRTWEDLLLVVFDEPLDPEVEPPEEARPGMPTGLRESGRDASGADESGHEDADTDRSDGGEDDGE